MPLLRKKRESRKEKRIVKGGLSGLDPTPGNPRGGQVIRENRRREKKDVDPSERPEDRGFVFIVLYVVFANCFSWRLCFVLKGQRKQKRIRRGIKRPWGLSDLGESCIWEWRVLRERDTQAEKKRRNRTKQRE